MSPSPNETPERNAAGRRRRKVERGVVTSDKMDKTIVVEVVRLSKHPKYEKYVKRNKRFHVHDEKNSARPGDRVEIEQTRPLSKSKRWRLLRVLKHEEAET